jgi:hypothetical protein
MQEKNTGGDSLFVFPVVHGDTVAVSFELLTSDRWFMVVAVSFELLTSDTVAAYHSGIKHLP